MTLPVDQPQRDPRLDRVPEFDPASRRFRAVEGIEQLPFRGYTWRVPVSLDQGREGACVGFGWAHELAARPWPIPGITNSEAFGIYYWARQHDEWPGENYDGTSVLAGAKAVTEWLPYVKEYRWAFGLDDVRRTIGYRGPVVLGLNWYEGMFEPQPDGRIQPTGGLMGGHCILAYSVSEHLRIVRLWNSWGPDWWQGGAWCYLTFDDLDRLLHEQGEACIPVTRRFG